MVVNGWYTCPVCHRRLVRVNEDTVLHKAPVYCRKCKVAWYPSIWMGRELADDEPFPLTADG